MSNLLYYPYINLPNSAWTIRAILYYNNIGSIIPEQYFYEPEHFEPFMREALRNELIEFINPIDALDNPGHVSDVFLTYLTNTPRIIDRRREDFACNNKARIHSGKFANKNSRTRIHVGKFDTNILLELTNMGLAVEGDDNWYYVENRTANELMTYLASVVANNINYIPATDRMDYHSFKSTYINNQDLEVHIRQYKRDLILKELIPYPEEIELDNLRRFKDQHHDLLNRFNDRVELITLNQHVMRIKPTSDNVAGYIYAWLDSPYAKPLIVRNTYGTVVDEIDDNQLSTVAIPLLKNKDIQQKINDLVLEAKELQYQAYLKEQEAINKMNEIISN